jgi:hypothetical protein
MVVCPHTPYRQRKFITADNSINARYLIIDYMLIEGIAVRFISSVAGDGEGNLEIPSVGYALHVILYK